jgi:diguanylate cyclase (GGDEF)-like protein/PAS domain S-box-containing protein
VRESPAAATAAADAENRPRLLIADDEPVVCAAIRAQLKGHFVVVGQAPDAASAIALTHRLHPDVALIDVEMPGGGLLATRVIHQESPATAVVILSSDRARSSVLQFLDAGAVGFLRKGTSAERLAARLGEAIAAHKLVHVPAGKIRRPSHERFRAAFDQSGIGTAIMSLQGQDAGRLVAVNDAYAHMLGYEPNDLVGRNAENWTHSDDLPEGFDDPLAALAAGAIERAAFETRYVNRVGDVVWANVVAATFCDQDGTRSAVVQTVDTYADRRFRAELEHQSDHDPLTGLYNRQRFQAELDRELAQARQTGGQGSVLALDLDGFRSVNDSLGWAAGDELMVCIAGAIRHALPEAAFVARSGGDEFAVLLPLSDPETTMLVARRLLAQIRRQEIVRHGSPARISASIGITTFSAAESITAEELLVEADIALADAKSLGKDTISVYRHTLRQRAAIAGRGSLNQLREAVEHDRLVLHAQAITPVCGAEDSHFELLVRILGDNRELIMPEVFLDDADRFGLIQSIDHWVLAQAVALLRRYWLQRTRIVLSVNLSPKTLQERDTVKHLRGLIGANPIPNASLVIEITETAAIANLPRASEIARDLRALGCRLALDDFGAGFATFYHLKHLRFDYIKIDGEFIKDLPDNPVDQVIVRAVVDIAREQGAETIAEFVQDDQTLRLLEEYGVGYSQGYHTGRPGPLHRVLPPLY